MDVADIAEAVRTHPDVTDVVVRPGVDDSLVLYVVPTADATDWGDLVGAATRQLVDRSVDLRAELTRWRSLWSTLDAATVPLMGRSLALLGAFTTADRDCGVDDLIDRHGVRAEHRPLLGQWLSVLARDGVLAPSGPGSFRAVRPFVAEDLDRCFADIVDRVEAGGVEKVFADYFHDCANHQVAILRGEVPALQMLFPDGDSTLAEAFYARNPISRVLNHVLAEALALLARDASANRPLRVLEIGGGTGATTSTVLPRLSADRVSYTFTDVSAYFLRHARERFAEHTFVEYAVLDLDSDPVAQGMIRHGYDVVVAANVLHTARDVDQATSRVRALLAPGGTLLAVERTDNVPTQMVTVGFLEGFSHYEDRRKATNLPLLGAAEWADVLRAAGFRRVAALPQGATASAELAEHLLVARVAGPGAPVDAPTVAHWDLASVVPPGARVEHVGAERIAELVASERDASGGGTGDHARA